MILSDHNPKVKITQVVGVPASDTPSMPGSAKPLITNQEVNDSLQKGGAVMCIRRKAISSRFAQSGPYLDQGRPWQHIIHRNRLSIVLQRFHMGFDGSLHLGKDVAYHYILRTAASDGASAQYPPSSARWMTNAYSLQGAGQTPLQ